MPKATVNTDTERYDLQTVEGGFVQLRRMSYGQKQQRQDIAMRLAIESTGKGSKKTERGLVEMSAEAIAQFEFNACVVDHNLYADDAESIKLNLSRREDIARLDPRIGEEISTLIDKLNNFEQEDTDDLGNASS